MLGRQFDLFSTRHIGLAEATPVAPPVQPPGATDLDDSALIAAIPDARLAVATALAVEAARRRLTGAVPALEDLCRRFVGFGIDDYVSEQMAALDALARIGGQEAAAAVARLIARRIVVGRTLVAAVAAAARLGARLPKDTAMLLLRHPEHAVRADICRCLGTWPEVVPILVALLDDPEAAVRLAAACALGRMGRIEGRPALAQVLRTAPTAEAIDAACGVADEDCIILLARIARTNPHLVTAATAALAQIDHPRALHLGAVLEQDQDSRDR